MKRFGLIGDPLSHSFSQRWFTELFKKEGLKDHRYDLYPLPSIEDYQALLREVPGLVGLNVTIPYKQAVMPLLDAIDPLAAAVGAVNTIAFRDGRSTGYNTDVEGFRSTLLPLLDGRKPRALLLGTGGASRAVAFVLREQGIKFRMISRSPERGDLTWEMVDSTVTKVCTLIINCTPLGMYPNVNEAPPLPYASIGPGHVLVDLVYNPEETLFMRKGSENGATVVNGLRMLEAQAEAAWRIWNEVPVS
jgi:shikimate dehydrogenase